MCEWHYEESNVNKTIFPAIIKPKLVWLKIVLFLLVICACWHKQGSVPWMFHGHNYLKIVKELSQGINTTLVILSLRTSSSVRCPDVCQPGMDVNHKITIFKVVPSLIMQHQDSFGSRTRFLLVLAKQPWERLVSSIGFMTNVPVKSSTIMVITVSSLWRSFGVTAKRSNKVSHSLALAPNTRMHMLNVLLEHSQN